MALHRITKGLDLPISGGPMQIIRGRQGVRRVAVLADDFPGMKPGMKVEVGSVVRRGQVLFEDRKLPGVFHPAPGAGTVVAIHRGARRVLQSVVIELSEGECSGRDENVEHVTFERYTGAAPDALSRDAVVGLLLESGLWTALRTRPFSRTPSPGSAPHSLFVTAIDSNPMAPLPEVVIEGRRDDFERGLAILSKLCSGTTFLCVREGSGLDGGSAPVQLERFEGPHPSGTVGLHIHLLDPVHREKTVWHIGYQDVIAAGRLFATGRLDVDRVISIGGPPVANPRLVIARQGASVDELAAEDGDGVETRRIAGSALAGKKAMGEVYGHLGRFDRQLTVLAEGRERVFMGWLTPGLKSFSTLPIYLSRLFGVKRFDFTTSTNGSPRAMVPIGMYERVMPMDILPTFLLRALMVGDIEQAEKLGVLELDEEDLALCTFVCPGKEDYGPILRRNLEMIEKEG
jgi:Na+-transporting NADH:ubiquinone oxidoreductase subunit A